MSFYVEVDPAARVNVGEELVMLVLGFESEILVSAIIPRIWRL